MIIISQLLFMMMTLIYHLILDLHKKSLVFHTHYSQVIWVVKQLTHWSRVTYIWVGNLTIISSDNGVSPTRRQAIIWTNAGIFLIGPLGTNLSEILIDFHMFSFKKMHLKLSSGKWGAILSRVLSITEDIVAWLFVYPPIDRKIKAWHHPSVRRNNPYIWHAHNKPLMPQWIP